MTDPVVIVYTCPVHGTLVEYDAPGPSPAHAPTSCWRPVYPTTTGDDGQRSVSICASVCAKLLVRSERPG